MGSTNLICGIVIWIIVCIALILGLLLCRCLKNKPDRQEYDETQTKARTRAYQLAFWMMVVYFITSGLAGQFAGVRWADELTVCMTGVFLGIGVFAGYSIWNGAYLKFQHRPQRICLAFVLVGGINIYYAYTIIKDDSVMLQNGMLTYYSVNLWLGILFFILGILIALRYKDDIMGR